MDTQAVAEALKQIKFDETFEGLVLTGEAAKDFQAALAKKSQALALQKKIINQSLAKIDRSTYAENYVRLKEDLATLLEQILVLQSFIDSTRSQGGDAHGYVESLSAVLGYGHSISKPYVFRLMECVHRNALLFADDDTVVDTMKPTSKLGGALHLALSGDDLLAYVAGRTDAIVLSMMQSYAKDKGSNKKSKRDGSLTAALVKRLTVYEQFAASHESPTVQCLEPLQFAQSLLDPHNALVHNLATAVTHLEQDKDQIKSAILVFFLGIGSTLLEEASSVLSNREAELANEQEKNKVVAEVVAASDIDWAPLDGLDSRGRGKQKNTNTKTNNKQNQTSKTTSKQTNKQKHIRINDRSEASIRAVVRTFGRIV